MSNVSQTDKWFALNELAEDLWRLTAVWTGLKTFNLFSMNVWQVERQQWDGKWNYICVCVCVSLFFFTAGGVCVCVCVHPCIVRVALYIFAPGCSQSSVDWRVLYTWLNWKYRQDVAYVKATNLKAFISKCRRDISTIRIWQLVLPLV